MICCFNEDILQGRVKFPIGGKVRESGQKRDRPGETPGPTVKVWMEEEFLVKLPL